MAKSFVAKDLETVKDFEIKAVHELDIHEKIVFIETQIEELKKVLWRERVDAVLAGVVTPADENQELQLAQKRQERKNNLTQYVSVITALHSWLTELRKLVPKTKA